MCSIIRSHFTEAALGIDAYTYPTSITVDAFKCFKNEGYEFFIAHLLHSGSGLHDKAGVQNVENAIKGTLVICTYGMIAAGKGQTNTNGAYHWMLEHISAVQFFQKADDTLFSLIESLPRIN